MTDPDFDPPVGIPETVEHGLRRILAPNPSAMTFRGTNTFLLGTRGIAVIDPGPDDPRHLDAILTALRPDQVISHIIVTHAHLDHSALSRRLSQITGAPILAFGGATAGRSAVMQSLAQAGLVGGGEGVDAAFQPDRCTPDGSVIAGDGWRLTVLHTPGHFGNHIALRWQDMLFCGDLVMGWSTSLVSPPDGDLSDFMTSCDRLRQIRWTRFHPAHGAPIGDPRARLDALIAHRKSREAAILSTLALGPLTATALAQRIYTEIPAPLLSAATRNVLAHLVDLTIKNRVSPVDVLSGDATFRLLDR